MGEGQACAASGGPLPGAPTLLSPPSSPPPGCSSPVLLHAGLHKMNFPGCANLAATCSRCAGASIVARLQTQSSWGNGCQPSSFPLLPPLLQRQQLGLRDILSPAVSWAAPAFPHCTPLDPPTGLPRPQPFMVSLQSRAQAGVLTVALTTLAVPHPQPRPSVPFCSPTS